MTSLTLIEYTRGLCDWPAVSEALGCLSPLGQFVSLCHCLAGLRDTVDSDRRAKLEEQLRSNAYCSRATGNAIANLRQAYGLPTMRQVASSDRVLADPESYLSGLDYKRAAELCPPQQSVATQVWLACSHVSTSVALEVFLRSDPLPAHASARYALVMILQMIRGKVAEACATYSLLLKLLFTEPPKAELFLRAVSAELEWGSMYDYLEWTLLLVVISPSKTLVDLRRRCPAMDMILDLSPQWKEFVTKWAAGDRDQTRLSTLLEAVKTDPLLWRFSPAVSGLIGQATVQSIISCSTVVQLNWLVTASGLPRESVKSQLRAAKFHHADGNHEIEGLAGDADTYIKQAEPELHEHFRNAQLEMDKQSWAAEQRKRIHKLRLALSQSV